VCVCARARAPLCLVCLEGEQLYERTGNILTILIYFEGSCS